jgi:hypothetical protein
MNKNTKRRGRPKKTKNVKNKKQMNFDINNITNNLFFDNIEKKSIIVTLKIKNIELLDMGDVNTVGTNLFEKKLLNYESVIEEPEGMIDVNVCEFQTLEETTNKKISETNIYVEEEKMIKKKTYSILDDLQYYEKAIHKTDIHCWHCCHKFDNSPIGIPYTIKNDKYHVFGIFCSFNCALTHNKNLKEVDNKIMEQESLIHMLYMQVYKKELSENDYAPQKETLEMFGGHLTIEEFRQNNKIYNIIFPPLIPIIPQLEEIEYIDLDLKKEETVEENITNVEKKQNLMDLFN